MMKKGGTDKNKSKKVIKFENACKVVIKPLKLENNIFRNALFKFHGIRDLRVVLQRVPIESVAPVPTKKMLLYAPNFDSVRVHVPWLPKAGSKPMATVNMKPMATVKLSQLEPTSFHCKRPRDDDGCDVINGRHATLQKG